MFSFVDSFTVIVVAILALAGFSLWCERKFPKPTPCTILHSPIVIDCQPVESGHPDAYLNIKSTAVLYRCDRCNYQWTVIINGTWNIETLQLKRAADMSIEALERMAR
jgi:hypothetical protein